MRISMTERVGRRLCWTVVLAALLSFLAADQAFAQRAGGGIRRGPRGAKPTEPEKPRPPERDDDDKMAPGRQMGRILSYKKADEEDLKEDGELLGTLKIKPYGKDTRVLSLLVRKQEDLAVSVADHTFEVEEYDNVLKKGLNVSAEWDFLNPDSKRDDKFKKKVLRTLRFETTEVEGEIEEVVDDARVIVAGLPMNHNQWPDYVPKQEGAGIKADDKVRRKKLKLMVIEDVSKIRTEDSEDAGLGDFKTGDKVRVTVVYAGGKPGFLVKLRPPGLEDDTPPPPKADEPRGGAPSGPQPGGPRGGRPVGGG